MADLDFRLLGPLEVCKGRTQLPLGGTKQRAVLAVLLVHVNEAVAPERLADELGTTGGTVQVYVARLRRLLGRETIATRPTGYALRSDRSRLDAAAFERLAEQARHVDALTRSRLLGRALALWRGPALADFVDEPFAQAPRARLEEMRLAAQEGRIAAELELGRHAEVVPTLAALVVEHPYRERLRALLMTALYRLGRQAEALAVYRDARRMLAGELGVEPSAELKKVERAILRQDEQ